MGNEILGFRGNNIHPTSNDVNLATHAYILYRDFEGQKTLLYQPKKPADKNWTGSIVLQPGTVEAEIKTSIPAGKQEIWVQATGRSSSKPIATINSELSLEPSQKSIGAFINYKTNDDFAGGTFHLIIHFDPTQICTVGIGHKQVSVEDFVEVL
jgi:hypothetical protein